MTTTQRADIDRAAALVPQFGLTTAHGQLAYLGTAVVGYRRRIDFELRRCQVRIELAPERSNGRVHMNLSYRAKGLPLRLFPNPGGWQNDIAHFWLPLSFTENDLRSAIVDLCLALRQHPETDRPLAG